LPLQEEASQEKEQPHRLGERVSRCARGKLAGVEADPGRAGTALACRTVATVDVFTASFPYNNVIVVHVNLFFLLRLSFELMKARQGLPHALPLPNLIYSTDRKDCFSGIKRAELRYVRSGATSRCRR